MKKVFIGVLAALMLFAFVACDNNASVKVPTGMTLAVSRTAYLEGEDFDPSTLTATVTYLDGSKETISGDALAFTVNNGKDFGINLGANSISATYGGALNGNSTVVGGSVYVTGYAPDSIVLANLPTTVEQNGGLDLTGATMTVTYAGDQTAELSWDAEEFKIGAKPASTAGTVGSKTAVTLSDVYLYDGSTNYAGKVTSFEWEVEIVEADVTLAAKDIKSIKAEVVNTDPIIVGEGGGAVEVKVTGYSAAGQTGTARVLDESEYTIGNGLSSIVFSEVKAYVFQVTLNEDPSVVTNLSVDVKDSLTNISVAQKSTVTITEGTAKTLTSADFDIKGVKASDNTTEVTTGFTNVVITPSYIAAHETAGTKYVTVSFDYQNQTFSVENVAVTIAAKTTTGQGD